MNNRDNEQDQTLPKRRSQFLIFSEFSFDGLRSVPEVERRSWAQRSATRPTGSVLPLKAGWASQVAHSPCPGQLGLTLT